MLLLLVPRYYPNIVYIEISHELPLVRIPPRESVSVRTCVRLGMLSARSLLQIHAVCLIFFRILCPVYTPQSSVQCARLSLE